MDSVKLNNRQTYEDDLVSPRRKMQSSNQITTEKLEKPKGSRHSRKSKSRNCYNQKFLQLLIIHDKFNEPFYMNDDSNQFTHSRRITIDPKHLKVKRTLSPKNTKFVTQKEKILRLKNKTRKCPKEGIIKDYLHFFLEKNASTREYMEDFINVEDAKKDKSEQVFILCDGHVGSKAAELVTKLLPDIFLTQLAKEKDDKNKNFVEDAITKSFITMDEVLKKKLDAEDTSGCTTNLVYICTEKDEKVVYSGNVGDSRSILIKDDENVLRLSYDHKATDKNEKKRVTDEGGVILRKRLYGTIAVTRCHGDFEKKDVMACLNCKPYVSRTVIEDTDQFLVIASDGIWDVISDEAATEFLTTTDFEPKDNLAKEMVNSALDYDSKDNISCIVIKLN